MNYLVITQSAINDLSGMQNLQSADYADGTNLVQLLRGNLDSWSQGSVHFSKIGKGGFLYTSRNDVNKKGLVFDLSTFRGFENHKEDYVITIFQKLLKFAIRYLENLPPAACERHFTGQDTSLVFPFPWVATKAVYRVIIDRNPDKRREERKQRNFLLVYGDGNSEGGGVQPNYANFKRAMDQLPELSSLRAAANLSAQSVDAVQAFKASSLEDPHSGYFPIGIGYDAWASKITQAQKQFIESPISGPERLEGAAGTGKTLALILRAIRVLNDKIEINTPFRLVFITHSYSSKKQIIENFAANWEYYEILSDKTHSPISITVTTLQEWCIEFIGDSIQVDGYLDRDAQDSKILQRMYLEEQFVTAMKTEFETYKLLCSNKFIDFFENSKTEDIVEMLQHEVAVTIKGRAQEDFERYKKLPRLRYSIPCETDQDKAFVFLIYRRYRDALSKTNQYDSDDIILTAYGKLNTPIWRRRKEREGFDAMFIDETHLFNINELSLLHYMNKEVAKRNIIFTIDKSQAVGDRGLADDVLFESLDLASLDPKSSSRLNTIFRSSPEIINLAFNVLSSGVTLFTNFDNPLERVSFSFTRSEEEKCLFPKYYLESGDNEMIKKAFEQARELLNHFDTKKRSSILLIPTSEYLLAEIVKYGKEKNEPLEIVSSRGDYEAVKSAENGNKYVVAGIDYVGGLEFFGVIVIGIDKGRVPPFGSDSHSESVHFLNYSWHNRLYVAFTRAKYALILIGDSSRGPCEILENAISVSAISLP